MRNQFWVVTSGMDWLLKDSRSILGRFANKTDAIASGVRTAQASQPSELFIQDARGQIQDRRTYGSDPFPPRG